MILDEAPFPLPLVNVEKPIVFCVYLKGDIIIFLDGICSLPCLLFIVPYHLGFPIIFC